MSNLSLGLGFGIGLGLILMPHWWFTYKMLGAEFEYELAFLAPVSDLVLF